VTSYHRRGGSFSLIDKADDNQNQKKGWMRMTIQRGRAKEKEKNRQVNIQQSSNHALSWAKKKTRRMTEEGASPQQGGCFWKNNKKKSRAGGGKVRLPGKAKNEVVPANHTQGDPEKWAFGRRYPHKAASFLGGR